MAILVASALTQPAEVVGLALAAMTIRGAAAGFLSLASGRPRREVVDDFTIAFISSLPAGALIAVALTVYLLFTS